MSAAPPSQAAVAVDGNEGRQYGNQRGDTVTKHRPNGVETHLPVAVDLLVVDEHAHNSIQEGAKIAKAGGVRVVNFSHCDPADLERVLRAAQPYRVAVVAILFVAAEALIGMACPLTVWEDLMRGGARPDSFVARWVRRLLYYEAPEWVFTTAYAAWAAATLVTLALVPPRRRAA